MRLHTFAVCLLLSALAPQPAKSKDTLQDLKARMDKAASGFSAMTADVQYVTHTDVINDDSTETGTVAMKKVPPGEVQGLVEFVTPDKRTVTFEKRKIQIYYPKMKTLQIWNLDQHGEQLDKFLMIGFGTSGTELAKDYDMTVLGTETVKGQQSPAIRLQLIPKSAEARQYVKKLELWIPSEGDPYPFREKISQPSNDYRLVTYSDLKINPPLKADAMRLKTPAGVKTEYPGK